MTASAAHDGLPTLLRAQMQAEWELAHAGKLQRYENALRGIASCATACACCRMHQEIAAEALVTPTSPTHPPRDPG